MYARVVMLVVKPKKLDELFQVFENSIIPAAKQQKGFQSLTFLMDTETDNGLSISVWATKEDMLSCEANGYYQQQLAKIADLTFGHPVEQHYEVRLQAQVPVQAAN
jgi:heme-degrading monooxygenase HmoA